MSEYELSYIEMYVPARHGHLDELTASYASHIHSNYLLMHTISASKFLVNPDKVTSLVAKAQELYKQIVRVDNAEHPIIRNFNHIMHNNCQSGLNIVQRVSDGEYTFAVLKTFWLKIVQRRWRNILIRKHEIDTKMKSPSVIKYREIHGSYPFSTNIYAYV
jgi:hypothetical protein